MAYYAGPRQQPGPGATSGAWLYFRLLACANAARGGAPVWSVPELAAVARAEGRHATTKTVHTALTTALLTRGLVERLSGTARADAAWRLTQLVRHAAHPSAWNAHHASADAVPAPQGRDFAEQHGVAVVPLVEGVPVSLHLWRSEAPAETPAADVPDGGAARSGEAQSRRRHGPGLWFRLLAVPNPAREGRKEWRCAELARAASAELGQPFSSEIPARWLARLATEGLVRHTYESPVAPYTYTAAGQARARELGISV